MTLKLEITTAVGGGIVLLALLLFFSGEHNKGFVQDRFEESELRSKQILWKRILSSEHDHMEAGAVSLARDRATKKALKKKDKAKLADAAATTFNLLQASNVLNALWISDASGSVLYAEPAASAASKIHDSGAMKALEEGKNQRNISRAKNGVVYATFSFPIFLRGKSIGVATYGRSLDHALADFKANDGSDVIIASESNRIEYSTDKELSSSLLNKTSLDQLSKVDRVNLSEKYLITSKFTKSINAGKENIVFVSLADHTENHINEFRFKIISYSLVVLAVLAFLGAATLYLNRRLSPLFNISQKVKTIADGNLSVSFPNASNNEIGMLQNSMQDMTVSLKNLLNKISDTSEELNDESQKFEAISQTTGANVINQRDNINQIMSSLTELQASCTQLHEGSDSAKVEISHADDNASQGVVLVEKTNATVMELKKELEIASNVVNELSSSSLEINDIVDAIGSIAEQTNLLALNAAIEAARAGEQGRGFAVVADEVRALASRTQSATQEIKTMIENLQEKATKCVGAMAHCDTKASDCLEHSSESSQLLRDIDSHISDINKIVEHVVSIAQQQLSITSDITNNLNGVERLSSENEQMAEEFRATSKKLSASSMSLSGVISKYTL